jgi:aspartate aminotransferase-like enzyme
MMKEEGFPRIYARHERNARATRTAAQALELGLLAPESPSPAVTGIHVPEGVDGGKLVSYLRDKMGVTFAGGQDHLKGKIVRVAHLGYMDTFDVITAVAALEIGLTHFGREVGLGRGVGAAEKVLLEALPA